MTRRKLYIFIAIIVLVTLTTVFLRWTNKPAFNFNEGDIVFKNVGSLSLPQTLPSAEGDNSSNSTWQKHEHPDPKFTIRFPEGYKTGVISEEVGQTIVIQNEKKGFQIFIAPYTESPVLTADLIKKDFPELSMKDVQEVKVAGGSGVSFFSDNNISEPSFEVWFVREGYIYEVSAAQTETAVMKSALETLKFN